MPTHFRYLRGLGDNQPGFVGTSGTVAIQLPTGIGGGSGTGLWATSVTCAGVRATDVLTASMMKGAATAYDAMTSARVLVQCRPQDDAIYLVFCNMNGSSNAYGEYIIGYTVTRPPA